MAEAEAQAKVSMHKSKGINTSDWASALLKDFCAQAFMTGAGDQGVLLASMGTMAELGALF